MDDLFAKLYVLRPTLQLLYQTLSLSISLKEYNYEQEIGEKLNQLTVIRFGNVRFSLAFGSLLCTSSCKTRHLVVIWLSTGELNQDEELKLEEA